MCAGQLEGDCSSDSRNSHRYELLQLLGRRWYGLVGGGFATSFAGTIDVF